MLASHSGNLEKVFLLEPTDPEGGETTESMGIAATVLRWD
jgi:hypothetical protein